MNSPLHPLTMRDDRCPRGPRPSFLTIAVNEDDVRCLEQLCPEALQGVVLAFDPDPHLALCDRGIKPSTPWDVVQHTDRAELERFDAQVWQFWSSHASVLYRGIDLLVMAQQRHRSCFSRLAWAACVID